MKTLETIQKLSKIGKVLSKIVLIFSLIGAIGCAAGIASLALLPESVKIGGTTVKGLVEITEDFSMGTAYAAMATVAIVCAGEAVLAKMAGRYFANELAAGTPFTFAGAKELLRLGICAICIPIGTRVLAEIVYEILKHALTDVRDELLTGDTVSVGLGVMMIVASLLCKYGAELSQRAPAAESR